MRKLRYLIMGIFFLLNISWSQTNQNHIALLDLNASGISKDESFTLTERLRYELIKTGSFTVIERQAMKTILDEQGFQRSGCTTDECAVEIGQLLNVQRMCAGSVGKVGSTYSIALRLIDVKSGKVVSMAIEDCKCPIDDVLTSSLKKAAQMLAGASVYEPVQTQNSSPVQNKTVPQKGTYGKVEINMITVEGGTFTMGDIQGDGAENEKPAHRVTVNSFFISKYEITQAQYQEVMGNNPSNFKGDFRPVEKVSWNDAIIFCNRLSSREGLDPCYSTAGENIVCNFNANGYRVPSEAEWEFAARGGNQSQGYKYSGSNTVSEVGWFSANSDRQTRKVGTKQANELGIHDMSGNVREWCWDRYGPYKNETVVNPTGPDQGRFRLLRGGSWFSIDTDVRVVDRSNNFSTYSINYVGFRIARTK